jgi:hypothetical protein
METPAKTESTARKDLWAVLTKVLKALLDPKALLQIQVLSDLKDPVAPTPVRDLKAPLDP